MSNHKGEMTVDWADGTYTFRLTVTGAIELEEKCSAPIATIVTRLNSGAYSVNDVRETIRLGLIGGGLKPHDALRLVRAYVDDTARCTFAESHALARVIAGGLMFGFVASPLAPEAGTEIPNGSTPPPSMPPHHFSGLEDLLTGSPSGNGLHS